MAKLGHFVAAVVQSPSCVRLFATLMTRLLTELNVRVNQRMSEGAIPFCPLGGLYEARVPAPGLPPAGGCG